MSRPALACGLSVVAMAFASAAAPARTEERKLAEMELLLLGVSATVEPDHPVIPKNTEAGVRIVLKAGERALSLAEATAFFGGAFWVEGELAGPGLESTKTLTSKGTGTTPAADPLLLRTPALDASGDYELNNLRVMAGGRSVLEVQPQHVPVKVIEQVLVTSVRTKPLTLDEIRAAGIVLDGDDYYAFEFTLGLKLESNVVDIKFPVAFDRQGVPVPQFLLPPPAPARQPSLPMPTIVPVLFQVDGGDEGSGGGGEVELPPLPSSHEPIRIPSVIVIPGNVGYLMQFFSAKLFVANGTPVGSGLNVSDVAGTIALPQGASPGPEDDPLSLAELHRDGHDITQPATMPVRGLGPDGKAETADDVATLRPGEQGEAEFFVRGNLEGFHTIDFDIRAVLEGLVTGPVKIKGHAKGPVLVRNPYFDVSFVVPGVIRTSETFKVFVTLTNLSDVAANSVSVSIPEGVTSGAQFVGTLPPVFPTIAAHEAKVFELEFLAQRTGQVVASYLRFDPEDGQKRPVGHLQLSVGIGERGVPLSPDTLVLPAAVDELPSGVVQAAMRVLGQAWSVANAPTGTLPSGVVRTTRAVVTQKALALAEAGLRLSLGQSETDAVRDVAFDFWGGQPLDAGFDQLLRTTDAGAELRRAIGAALAAGSGVQGALELEADLADVASSGPDFASFAVAGGSSGSPLGVTLSDGAGRATSTAGASEVTGAALLRLGPEPASAVLGIVATASAGPYTLDIASGGDTNVDISITLPRGDGTFVRAEFRGVRFLPGTIAHVSQDPGQPDRIVLEKEGGVSMNGGGTVYTRGPRLVSANIIGPETLQGASPFGFQLLALFDRVVDAGSAAEKSHYKVPKNGVLGAKSQLSGRLVFVSLEQPEGRYVGTTFEADRISDPRGNEGVSGQVTVESRIEDPGAVVTGHVLKADGTPVGAGTVTYVNNSNVACGVIVEKGFSAVALDSRGYYELRYVRQDNCGTPFKVVTQDPATGARRQASAYVRAAGEAITLDLVLLGGGAVEGTVRDVHGVGVPGANVVAYSQTDPQVGGAATTDAWGHYFVEGITVGPVVVKAGKGAALGSAPGNIERAGATATVDIVLDGGAARVYGKVYKVEGGLQTAVPGIPVYFTHFNAGSPLGQLLGVAVTTPKGGYDFDGVPVGEFEVAAALNTRDRGAQRGVAVAGQPVEKNILIEVPEPEQLATVSGQVYMTDGRTPATDVAVTVGGHGKVFANGAFTIAGVAVRPGPQVVMAQSLDGRRSGSTTVVANEPRLYDGLRIELSGLGNAAFRVLDEAGQPVKGQLVALLGQCGNPCGCATTLTDPDGVAVFRDVSYGNFYGKAIRSTATARDVANGAVAVVADGTTALTTMRFAGTGRVEGTVRDADGGPVQGADVTLWSQRFVNDGTQTCDLQYAYAGATRTGLDGRYAFSGINLGPVSVSATGGWFGENTFGNKGILAQAGQTLVLDIAFEDTIAGILSGDVFLPGGGHAGAGVEVAVEGPLPEIKVTTDADGHYEFRPILPEGYYTLTAHDPVGGGLARSRIALRRQEPLTVPVQLKGRGNVRVQVVAGPDDEPVESALVKLTETEYPSRTFDQSVRPGTQGTVLFVDVYEGPLRIDVSDPFARSASVKATLPGPGVEIAVQVKLTPTGRVTGRFKMPSGEGIPYGTVALKAGGKLVGQTTAQGPGDDAGRFSFDYVPVGPITLDAQDPLTARVGTKSGTLDHEGDPPLEIDVIAQGLGRVHGTVRRGEDAQALARVVLTSGSYRATMLTDGQGLYDVSGVPEGRVTVTASLGDQGFLAGTTSAVLEGDGQSLQIDVALREAGAVDGQIVPASEEDRAAGRFPAATVHLSVGGTGGGSQETSTRPDGTFSFEIVPTGRVTFTADVVDSIDHGAAVEDVVAGPNSVEIPLQGVGRLKGIAVASEDPGAPPVDGWIFFSGSAFPDGGRVTIGTDGQFDIPEVLAGDFTARLQHGQGALALYGSASGTVAPGQETEITVALQASGEIRGSVVRPAATPEGKRPAFGAAVAIVLAKGGQIPLLAQEDGTFSVKGVPLGGFLVRVSDPISAGHASLPGLLLGAADRCGAEAGTCHDVGEILIDDAPPALTFVEPAPGSTRAPFGGLLVIQAAADVDPSSIVVRYPNGQTQGASAFAFVDGSFHGTLYDPAVQVGANRLAVTAKDTAGNEGNGEVWFTVLGGTAHGRVLGSDGQPRAGVAVRLGALETTSQAGGSYAFTGLRAGSYSAKAIDPDTGLESPASPSRTLLDGGELELDDLQLPAAGRLNGVVVHKYGAVADGVTVKWSARSDVTKNGGLFDLGFVAAGSYALQADGPDGDVGAASASVPAGGPANAQVRLNGVGQVEVTVKDAGQTLLPNVGVSVSSSAPFPRAHAGKKTGPAGEAAAYDRVLSGTITATASVSGLGGETTGFLDDGGLLRLTVALQPAGRVSGVVSHAGDGPASGVTVRLTGPKTATFVTGSDGTFAFENVPFGHFSLNASTAEGDFGSAEGDLSSANPDVTAPIALNGLGTVEVHVTDATGAVAGAHVTVTSLGRSGSAAADGNGIATVANVRAAATVTAKAEHPTTVAEGEKEGGPLAPGGTLRIDVELETLGTVSGTVFGPAGEGAVDGVLVRLNSTPTAVTHDGGQFSFTGLKPGSYTLAAYVADRLRARETVVLDGAQASKDLTLVGVGTVEGTVAHPGGGVAGVDIHLYSKTPLYGGSFDVKTGAEGTYEIQGVPVGAFTVDATLEAESATAHAEGTVSVHGEEVTVDLELLDSAITIPSNFMDGNGLQWTVSADGRLGRGQTFTSSEGTPRLTVVRGETSASFTGPACSSGVKCAPTEENGREVVLSQADLLGLKATRKLFFPADGYFVRVIDFLQNPATSPPATLSVLRETRVGGTTILGTSSGDAVVASDDDWVAVDDALDDDIYRLSSPGNALAPSALVLSGPGRGASSSLLASQPAPNRMLLSQTWDGVRLEPGQTVAFMSLLAAQADRARARASAERLVQLPPEALAGLSPEEAGEIVNFAVPADVVSPVPPLPPNDGVVAGRTLASDGQTPSDEGGWTAVEFRSRSPYYGRPLTKTSSTSTPGAFSFTGTAAPSALVPRTDFDLRASASPGNVYHPFAVDDVVASAAFPLQGVIDLTNVAGRVLRASSWNVSSQTPDKAVDDDLATSWHAARDDAASKGQSPFLEIGLPGSATVHEVRVRGTRTGESYSIRAGRIELRDASDVVVWSQDVLLPPVGGFRDGDFPVEPPVPGVRSVRFTSTSDLSYPGLAELRVLGEADLGPAREARQDLVFGGTGRLEVTVKRSDETPVPSSHVWLSDGTQASSEYDAAVDSTGTFWWRILPPGTYTVYARHPTGSPEISVGSVAVSADTLTHQDLVFEALGSLTGTITTAKNGPISATVRLQGAGFQDRTTSSSATTGLYAFTDVPPGAYTVTVTDKRTGFPLSRTVAVAAGPATIADFTLRPVTTIDVTATVGSSTGPPLDWGAVSVEEEPGRGFRFVGYVYDGRTFELTATGPTATVRVETTGTALPTIGEGQATFDEGDAVALNIVVPGLGTIQGRLLARDGKAVATGSSRNVFVASPEDPTKKISTAAGADASFQLASVPVRPLLLRGEVTEGFGIYSSRSVAEVPVALTAPGQVLQQDALAAIGDVSYPGKVDAWEIRPASGAGITLLLGGRAYADVGALDDPLLEVFGPDGALVAANDDRGPSDKKSEVGFTAAAGPYVILAHGARGATGGYRLASWQQNEDHVFRPYGGRLFGGHVTRLEDGLPAAGQGVRLLRRADAPEADVVLVTLAADPQGVFSFPGLWSGTLAIEAVDATGVALARRELAVAPGEDPGPLDLVVPVHGTVRVHVTRGADVVSGVLVEVESAHADLLPGDQTRTAATDATGTATFLVPVGPVTARAVDPARPGSSPVEAEGTVSETVPADLAIDFGIVRVDLEGVVRNDGGTPLPGATVELVGLGTSPPTGPDGSYRFTNVLGARTWTIKASHPKAAAPQTVTLALGAENARQDFTLAVPMLIGHVREPDGTGVAGAQVRACEYYYGGYYSCLSPFTTLEDGLFYFVGRPGWYGVAGIRATLQDGSNLSASVDGIPFSNGTTGTVEQDVTLPLTASVSGTVTDLQHATVPGAQVSLHFEYDWGSYQVREGVADGYGGFAFRHLQIDDSQAVRVYAESPAGEPGEGRGTLDPGQELHLDVSLVESAELRIGLVDENGAPIDGGVTVQSLLAPSADGQVGSRNVSLLAAQPDSGRVRVPLGPFRVVHDDLSHNPGAAEGELGSGESLPVTVRRGSHRRQPLTLDGPEGSYTTEGWCGEAWCGPMPATVVPGLREDYPPYVRLESEERGLRSLQLAGVGLRVSRQQHVPPSGAFARTMTTLHNTSDHTMSVVLATSLRVDFGYALSGGFAVGDPLGIVEDGNGSLMALLVGSRLPAATAEFRPPVDYGEGTEPGALATEHVVTLERDQRVAFLTFSLASTDGDRAALDAKAAALLDLSHPEALAGLTASEREIVVNFDVPPLGDVEGTVTLGGAGVVGAEVGLVDAAGTLVASTATGEQGSFALRAVPPGSYSVAVFDPASSRRGRVSVDVVAGAVSPAHVVLLDDAALGAVRASAAWERVGGPVAGAELTLSLEGFGPIGEATGVTDDSGEALFTGIPPGVATVRWPAEYRARPGSVEVVPGQTVVVDLVAPAPAGISGHILGGAAQVPVPYARVEAFDVATGDRLAWAEADEAGVYALADVRAGALGFEVRAILPADPAVQAARQGIVSQAYETIEDFDLVLPVAALTGRVFFDGGSEPVPYPNVFATPTGVPDPRTYYADSVGPDGSFTVLVGGAGDYLVSGQDNDSGLTGQASAHVADLGTGANVPVVLPPSGSVTVTVSDPAGGTVSAASVALTSLGLAFDRFGDVDASGSFTFDRVALGAFHVQAVEQSGISRRGSAAGELAGAGGSVTVPIALPQTTTLQGEVLGATYGASVEAVGLDHDGPLGLTEAWAWASPTFSLTVPIGSVRVGAVDGAGDPPLAGLAEGEAGPGSSTVDVGLGNAVSLSADLAGSDGFQYVVDCNGTLTGGGTSDASAAYWSANYLSVADRGFPGWPCLPALADEEGRELAIGARDVAGIRVARKVYVPPYGGFARYLEVLTNTGTAPVTVPVTVAGNLRSDAATRILASPASTGRTYALTDADECCRPVLGHVFAGPDGRVVVQATHFDPGDGYYSYRWTVTIGPGATVAFMHFAVQRDRQDADGARQQAEALVSLADPHALEGMTSEERSQVVNFDVR